MICHRCLQRSLRSTQSPFRTFSSVSRLSNPENLTPKASPTTAGRTADDKPAATSTPSAAQPFSTPPGVSPTSRGQVPKKKDTSTMTIKSSVAAGTSLKGLNFLKGKDDPVAMEDHEYPDWLWGILRDKKKEEDGIDLDIFSKSRTKRQKALKKAKKAGMNPMEAQVPRVPLYEQTIDLPRGDGTLEGALEANEAREELTKAMRNKRRAAIKEDNFLRTMS